MSGTLKRTAWPSGKIAAMLAYGQHGDSALGVENAERTEYRRLLDVEAAADRALNQALKDWHLAPGNVSFVQARNRLEAARFQAFMARENRKAAKKG
jgi:hypothetical protein